MSCLGVKVPHCSKGYPLLQPGQDWVPLTLSLTLSFPHPDQDKIGAWGIFSLLPSQDRIRVPISTLSLPWSGQDWVLPCPPFQVRTGLGTIPPSKTGQAMDRMRHGQFASCFFMQKDFLVYCHVESNFEKIIKVNNNLWRENLSTDIK